MYHSLTIDLLKDIWVVCRFWQGPGTWGPFASLHRTLHVVLWYIFGQLPAEGHRHGLPGEASHQTSHQGFNQDNGTAAVNCALRVFL